MSKYTKELKLSVIHDYHFLKFGYIALSKKFDVPKTILRGWIIGHRYHGVSYFDKHYQIYTPDFKLKVLAHMKEHHMTALTVAAYFGIPAFTSVLQWQRLYNSGGEAALITKPRGRSKMKQPKPESKQDKSPSAMSQDELLEEVLNLRAERDYLKKLQALIQEKQLGVKNKPH